MSISTCVKIRNYDCEFIYLCFNSVNICFMYFEVMLYDIY